MPAYSWKPIMPLQEAERRIDIGDLAPLFKSWWGLRARLRDASGKGLQAFTDKLVRSLSVETGIIERLYDLDRGTTETLVMHGFAADLVERNATNIEPTRLIDILKDHEAAVRLVVDCISQSQPLSVGVLNELHALLTAHQESTEAKDPLGRYVQVPLKRGAFKAWPNNPQTVDGAIHEYCPPVHVPSEVDNLVSWFGEYQDEDPLIQAAWLHHRFTQIHPYQDGNGRLARVLITFVLLRHELLPVVIDRDIRVEYLDALRRADDGDLGSLVSILASKEKTAILQALSLEGDLDEEPKVTQAVIASIQARLQRRKEEKDEELRGVNDVAQALRKEARELVEASLNELKPVIELAGEFDIVVHDGGPDQQNAHWYKYEVIESSTESQKWVNFDEDHYFIKAAIRVQDVRLVFVTSIHHIGRRLSGVMEATAFAQIEYYGEDDSKTSSRFFVCSRDPFALTWFTDVDAVREQFRGWLDVALAVAVKAWGDKI